MPSATIPKGVFSAREELADAPGGNHAAIDNCVLLSIDPYAHLVDVIRKLKADWPLRQLSELIPRN